MQSIAHARHVRISPRKVDQILMMVRGKSVTRALSVLALVAKGARPLVEKTLTSAFANAGPQQSPEAWYVQQAWVGAGPVMKRMRAHAMGRGATIRHRTAHVTIILTDQKPKTGKAGNSAKPAKKSATSPVRGA